MNFLLFLIFFVSMYAALFVTVQSIKSNLKFNNLPDNNLQHTILIFKKISKV